MMSCRIHETRRNVCCQSVAAETETPATMQSEVHHSSDHSALRADDALDENEVGRSEGVIDSLIKPLIAIDTRGDIQDITPVAPMLLKGQVNKFKGRHISHIFPELEGANWAALAGLSTQARRDDGSP